MAQQRARRSLINRTPPSARGRRGGAPAGGAPQGGGSAPDDDDEIIAAEEADDATIEALDDTMDHSAEREELPPRLSVARTFDVSDVVEVEEKRAPRSFGGTDRVDGFVMEVTDEVSRADLPPDFASPPRGLTDEIIQPGSADDEPTMRVEDEPTVQVRRLPAHLLDDDTSNDVTEVMARPARRRAGVDDGSDPVARPTDRTALAMVFMAGGGVVAVVIVILFALVGAGLGAAILPSDEPEAPVQVEPPPPVQPPAPEPEPEPEPVEAAEEPEPEPEPAAVRPRPRPRAPAPEPEPEPEPLPAPVAQPAPPPPPLDLEPEEDEEDKKGFRLFGRKKDRGD